MSDEISLARMRERLVARVVATSHIGSEPVAAALRDVPRHLFLPHLPPESAYRDDAIVTKRGADGEPISSSSQPAIMAIMLEQLDLAPGQRVLEIGAGTGYNAALIRHIVGPSGTVVSMDIDSDLAEAARDHLASVGYRDVTVVAADGAEGYPAWAPYDRVIATVGVSDLAPAWLDQAGPDARIVVPLDVRGAQLSVAFGRAGLRGADSAGPGPAAHWTSRSIAPCGFMRMRGSLAGPERTVVLQPGLSVMLPDGLTLADGHEVDPAALAAALDGPPVELPTGVRTGSGQVFWGLGLWLAAGDPRSCGVAEVRLPGRRRAPARGGPAAGSGSPAGGSGSPAGGSGSRTSRLSRAPLSGQGARITVGIVDSGGIAVVTATPVPTQGLISAGTEGQIALEVSGFGPHAFSLATALAAHVQAWDNAGQPGTLGLHVDAYPRSSPDEPAPVRGGLLIERPSTRFLVYHT